MSFMERASWGPVLTVPVGSAMPARMLGAAVRGSALRAPLYSSTALCSLPPLFVQNPTVRVWIQKAVAAGRRFAVITTSQRSPVGRRTEARRPIRDSVNVNAPGIRSST